MKLFKKHHFISIKADKMEKIRKEQKQIDALTMQMFKANRELIERKWIK
jgi:hypothetical protein